jgi:polyketide biosynthesis enoyl-CoA hydratase PksH
MTTAETATVTVRRQPGLLRVTLDRPDAGNALRPDTLDALAAALDLAERDESCRGLILDGAGDRFCTGLDLVHATRVGDGNGGGVEAAYLRLLRRLGESPIVTVAVVDGPAIGGGVGLACACDLVLAGDAATFRLTEVLLGLLPGVMLWYLARRVGEQCAYRMALLAQEFGAAQALERGLADAHAPRAEDAVRHVVLALRRADRGTLGELKALRRRLFPNAAEDHGARAGEPFGGRLDDPRVRDRIARFRSEGMLP